MESWKPKLKPFKFPRIIVVAFRHPVDHICDIDIGMTSPVLEPVVEATQTAVRCRVSTRDLTLLAHPPKPRPNFSPSPKLTQMFMMIL